MRTSASKSRVKSIKKRIPVANDDEFVPIKADTTGLRIFLQVNHARPHCHNPCQAPESDCVSPLPIRAAVPGGPAERPAFVKPVFMLPNT